MLHLREITQALKPVVYCVYLFLHQCIIFNLHKSTMSRYMYKVKKCHVGDSYGNKGNRDKMIIFS